MDNWESELAKATAGETKNILGAIGLVVNGKGETLYQHASGRQSLSPDAPPLNPNSTIALHSAGKFITHIAALQLVERGLITLDEPVHKHIPELKDLPLVSRGTAGDELLTLRPPTTQITLRHLLTHTSGLSSSENPLIREYLASDAPKLEFSEDAHKLVKLFAVPLIFEPGEGFSYGGSIHFTQLLLERLGNGFSSYIKENVFVPLGLKASSYAPRQVESIWDRRLQMVERVGDRLEACDDQTQGLTCSVEDVGAIFSDLLAPTPKVLRPESTELLFTGQVASGTAAERGLQGDPENYAFVAGQPGSAGPPAVSWSFAGLLVTEELPRSRLPRGTVTWEGWPNVMWAMNRERRLAMFFGTQLIPVGDETANDLAVMFMRDAWSTFG